MQLPNFTPRRLVEEAVLAHNLLHLEQIDLETALWPDLIGVILSHLRHAFTDYDELLSRSDYDPELRDALAAQVAKAAHRTYPWLKKDPRPFPEITVTKLVFDKAATDLAEMHGQANLVNRAIQDLRHQPRTPEVRKRIQDLSETLTGIRTAIDHHNKLFEPAKDNTPNTYLAARSPERLGQYSFNGRDLALNYLDFAGFNCPNCNCAIKKTKQPRNFGQKRKLNAYSCGCLSYALDPPPPGKDYGFAVDLTLWSELIDTTYTTNEESKTY